MENKPSIGEIVICKITKINPHSAFAIIEEYNIEGLIHISEVASGWVKDISQHLKEGHTIVAKVVNVDTNIINLSQICFNHFIIIGNLWFTRYIWT